LCLPFSRNLQSLPPHSFAHQHSRSSPRTERAPIHSVNSRTIKFYWPAAGILLFPKASSSQLPAWYQQGLDHILFPLTSPPPLRSSEALPLFHQVLSVSQCPHHEGGQPRCRPGVDRSALWMCDYRSQVQSRPAALRSSHQGRSRPRESECCPR
jgi:hypothetical protein